MMNTPYTIGSAELTHEMLMSVRSSSSAPGRPRLWLTISAAMAARLTYGAVTTLAGITLEIEPTEALVGEINEHCVYRVTQATANDSYYLELSENYLMLKYQQILGSRTFVPPTPETQRAFAVKLCEIFDVQMPEPPEAFSLAKVLSEATPAFVPEPAAEPEPETVLKRELRLLRAEGTTIFLPEEILTEYKQIKALIEKAGGKYKRNTFVFGANALGQDVLDALIGGDSLNPQKKWQFFQSPLSVADAVVADVGPLAGKRVLEPSAGEGVIAQVAIEQGAAEVVTVEAWDAKAAILRRKGFNVIERDFLSVTPKEIGMFDVVVANPPFTSGQDIDHVNHMLTFLKPGGVLSSVMSVSWQHGQHRKQVAFRKFLASVEAKIVPIAAGVFKESGTTVSTVRVVIEADRVAALTGLREAA